MNMHIFHLSPHTFFIWELIADIIPKYFISWEQVIIQHNQYNFHIDTILLPSMHISLYPYFPIALVIMSFTASPLCFSFFPDPIIAFNCHVFLV